MNWTELRSASFRLYYASTQARREAELARDLRELLDQLRTAVLPLHEPSSWDHIRVTLDGINGKISAFPALHAKPGSERGACDLHVSQFAMTQVTRLTTTERRYARLLFKAWVEGVTPRQETYEVLVAAYNYGQAALIESEWLPIECFEQ